jgi:glycine cleavage system H lipoate-binding protein
MPSIAHAPSSRFALPADRLYLPDRHVWAQMQNGIVCVGVSAPLREVLAFAPEVEFWAVDRVEVGGTLATAGGRDGRVVAIATPVAGSIVELNPLLERAPHALLSQPYQAGWVARLACRSWDRDAARLVGPGPYRGSLDSELPLGRDLCFGGAVLAPAGAGGAPLGRARRTGRGRGAG